MKFDMLKNIFAAVGVFFAAIMALSILLMLVFGGRGAIAEPDVAVVSLEGIITDAEDLREQLKEIEDTESIKAVVLRINTPGGAVGPSQEIHSEIKRLKKTKKVVASMGAIAASGGYYAAVAADRIVANPGTITGSIGVIVEFINAEELLGKLGLKGYVIKSGRFKDSGSPMRKMEDEEKKLLQAVVDDINAQFITAVATGRSLKIEEVREIADGRIFSGAQARERGLVDDLGDLTDAIDIGAKLAGIKEEPEVMYTGKGEFEFFELFREGVSQRVNGFFAELFTGMRIMYLTPNFRG